MNHFPFFRWFVADAETDEIYNSLTDEELGFYHRCLNRAWTNDGLPGSMDRLAATMRVTLEYLDRVWPNVSQCFVLTEDARWVNPRQEMEREYAQSKSEHMKRAGNNNAKRRSNADETQKNAIETQMNRRTATRASVSVSDSSSDFLEKESEEKPSLPAAPSRFGEWLDGFRGRKADADAACRAWLSVDADSHADAAFACRDRYLASDEVARGVVMEAAKFIFQQGRNGWSGDWPRARQPTATLNQQRRNEVVMGMEMLDEIRRRKDGV